jgi:hypothetical protein
MNHDPRRYSAPVFDLQAYRDQIDNDREDHIAAISRPRARWLNASRPLKTALRIAGFCLMFWLVLIIWLAAWMRAGVTP